ncbi:MAG: hypothetical protein JRD68_15225 [Deltaproteobacteria bacterium]|nr:hypothetical protein [Deltaproteobacteria bacterium]
MPTPDSDMPSWEEWNAQLTEEQRQYSLYKILESINVKLSEREEICGKRFSHLEKRKKWNSAESLFGGIIGGILAIIGSWAFWRGP